MVLRVYNGAGVSHRRGTLVLAYKQAETNGAAERTHTIYGGINLFLRYIDMLSKPLRAGAASLGLTPLVTPAPTCNRAEFPGLLCAAAEWTEMAYIRTWKHRFAFTDRLIRGDRILIISNGRMIDRQQFYIRALLDYFYSLKDIAE